MESDYLYKVVLIGEWGVGKTNILTRYTRGEFLLGSPGTIGVQFSSKTIEIEEKRVKVQVWDMAGQDKYRAITSSYYRGAHGALLVYDITRMDTFRRLDFWIKELKEYVNEDCVIILIGNKSDLVHLAEVKQQDGLNYSALHNLAFFETSALDSTNIQPAFNSLIQKIHSQKPQTSFPDSSPISTFGKQISLKITEKTEAEKKKKTCC